MIERTLSPSSSRSATPEPEETGPSLSEELEALLARAKAEEDAVAARNAVRRESSVTSSASRAGKDRGKGKKAVNIKREGGVKVKRERPDEQRNQEGAATKRCKVDHGVIDLTASDNDDQDEGADNAIAGSARGSEVAGGGSTS